jgi:outer membrane receptor protein involved in Fe transport
MTCPGRPQVSQFNPDDVSGAEAQNAVQSPMTTRLSNPTLTDTRGPRSLLAFLCFCAPGLLVSHAQDAADEDEEVVQLSVFEVSETATAGYLPTSSVVASGFAIENVKNPINVASLSNEFVDDLKFDDLADAVGYISNAQKSPSTDGSFHGSRMQVRGFETSWFNRNGVRRYVINGTDNLDRLEVIKGPAAVFFGQASPGGVVNYVTKRPSFITQNSVDLRYGSYDYKYGEIETQGSVFGSKHLAYRVNASRIDKEDWRDFEWQKRDFIYGGLLFQPIKQIKIYAEYERIKDENNDALGLPQGNPIWLEDYLAIPNTDNEVTNYYVSNPTLIGLPAGSTRDAVVTRLQGRWRTRDPGSPGGNARWSSDSIAAWTALGRPADEAAARFPMRGEIIPEATPYGRKWNNLGAAGFVEHELENMTLEGTWEIAPWFSLRSAMVWDNAYRTGFLRNEQSIGTMTPDGPAIGLQKLEMSGLANESLTFVVQGVFSLETGPVNHTLLLGRDNFQDNFLEAQIVNRDTTTPATMPDWNYFTMGYPEQSPGQADVVFNDLGKTAERTSYTANYIARLWDSKVVAMAGIRSENFKSWDPYTGELGRDTTASTPSFGAVWEPVAGINLFGSYSESYTAYGPYSATVNRSIGLTQEQIEDYYAQLGDERWPQPVDGSGFDLGIKTNWRDSTISGTVSYFEVTEVGRFAVFDAEATLAEPLNADWLASHPGATASQLPILRNAIFGESRARGFECDLSFLPARNWMILVSYARFFEAEFDQASGPSVRMVATPHHSYSVWSKYDFRDGRLKGLKLGLGFNGKTDYFLRPTTNNYYFREDGFVVCDAFLEYALNVGRDGKLRFGVNAKNILGEEYYAGGASAPGDARRFIFSIGYEF